MGDYYQAKREYWESTNDKTFRTSIIFQMLFYILSSVIYLNKPAEADINRPSQELKFNRAKQNKFFKSLVA